MKKLIKLYKANRYVMLMSMIIEGLICYGFISLSIARGNLWWYLLALIFLVRTVKDLFRLIWSFVPHDKQAAGTR